MVEEAVVGGVFAVAFGSTWVWLGWRVLRHERQSWVGARRARRAERTAVEVSVDDGAFAPEAIRASVAMLLCRAGDVSGLESDDPDLAAIRLWTEQHRLGNMRRLDRRSRVNVLQVIHRGDVEDRVIVRVRGRIHLGGHRAPDEPTAVGFDERWTLRRTVSGWRLVEFDSHPLAEALLDAQPIVGLWADEERLREQSLAELGHEPVTGPIGELIDGDADPGVALLDLSVIDGRFVPALIEADISRLIDAWEQAALGETTALAERASGNVMTELLNPIVGGRPLRFVLRDARLKRWHPLGLTTDQAQVRLTVAVTAVAVRYLTNADQSRTYGNTGHAFEVALQWTLDLTNRVDLPWLLTATTSPAADIYTP